MALIMRTVTHLKMIAQQGVTTANKAMRDATSADPAKYQSPIDNAAMFNMIMDLRNGIGKQISGTSEKRQIAGKGEQLRASSATMPTSTPSAVALSANAGSASLRVHPKLETKTQEAETSERDRERKAQIKDEEAETSEREIERKKKIKKREAEISERDVTSLQGALARLKKVHIHTHTNTRKTTHASASLQGALARLKNNVAASPRTRSSRAHPQ